MGYTYVFAYRNIENKYICFVVCYTIIYIYIYIHIFIHIEYVYMLLWARPISILYIYLYCGHTQLYLCYKYIVVVCATLIYVDRPLGSTCCCCFPQKHVSINKQINKTRTVPISKFLKERNEWLRLVTNKYNMNTNNHYQ